MSEKFKISAEFIKDLSSETKDVQSYLFVKENILLRGWRELPSGKLGIPSQERYVCGERESGVLAHAGCICRPADDAGIWRSRLHVLPSFVFACVLNMSGASASRLH